MAIQVITYKNSAEIIRIDKSAYLSNRQDMSNYVKFEGGQNLLSPTFYINSTTEPTFNYVHIPDFNRYYFVDSKQWVGNNMWFITLSVDVLFSHKNDILKLTGIASRLEDQGKYSMIIDDRITAVATQYSNMHPYELTISEGYEGFDIQDSTTPKRIVFSCFSGDATQAETGGADTMTVTKNGVQVSYSPSFNQNYESDDGPYKFSGAGNYTVTIRGSGMEAPAAWGISGLNVYGTDNVVTVSNINITETTNVYIQILTDRGTRGFVYRLLFSV